MDIRRAQVGDAPLLSIIGTATFVETYQTIVPGHDMAVHCATRHAPAFYETLLRDAANSLFLAETPVGAPAGYVWVGAATLPVEAPDARDRELHRIYVLGRYHGTGLGDALMERALVAAGNARRLMVGLHAGNARARAFYTRHGFQHAGARRFQVGARVFDDLVLARPMERLTPT